ncbi:hypothetical protein IP78_13215 [Brevundimonas sp. AAP58]|uniref:DUF6468 domain-containing protein n=1 Tax=Brevundimonas sp. AAP58 TaxID=1523422 RepID=UPI0006B998B3|nr:DUF6468 domain-containing protein [Brevundimonas sp. AAP58]KPF76484.1 hypothetical protein IP78_13215 [Brevundimonas sp. AAP58]
MTGMIMDAVLMLLLVAALGYGVRLERKLSQLRAGQLAFAGAVTELNAACTRAENALSSLRASGEEADLLHDRIIKARALKTDLEALVVRGSRVPSPSPMGEGGRSEAETGRGRPGETDTQLARVAEPPPPGRSAPPLLREGREKIEPTPNPDDRAFRMAALAERIQGLKSPTTPAAAGAGNVDAILHALTANQSAKQSLNRARASLADDDLFAA